MGYESIDPGVMRQLPLYIGFLCSLPKDVKTVSPNRMAAALLLDPQIVRLDMRTLMGKDRACGESREVLLAAIARLTEIQKVKSAVLVGVGKLGFALMSYSGFSVHDLDIMAGFDINPKVIKKGTCGKPVYRVDMLSKVCRRLNARIGVITTPGGSAQAVCDALISCGITAILNFSCVRLKAPPDILIHNEDMSATLRRLAEYAAK